MKNFLLIFICIFSSVYSQCQNDPILLVFKNKTRNNINFPFFKSNKDQYLFSYKQSNDTLFVECNPDYTKWIQCNGYRYCDGICGPAPRHKFEFSVFTMNEKNIKTVIIHSYVSNDVYYFKRKDQIFINKKIVHIEQ
jgi:hypothetical protein